MLAARDAREVIVGADCNGRSALWCSSEDPEPDHFKVSRGLILEDIISEYNLTVLNDSSLGSTCYIRKGATSQVDITLSTDKVSRKLTDWRLLQFVTKGDHAVIMVDLKLHQSELKKFQSTSRTSFPKPNGRSRKRCPRNWTSSLLRTFTKRLNTSRRHSLQP